MFSTGKLMFQYNNGMSEFISQLARILMIYITNGVKQYSIFLHISESLLCDATNLEVCCEVGTFYELVICQ